MEIIKAADWPAYAAALPPITMLLDPLIPARSTTLLHGPPGCGKSALMWGIGNAVTLGEAYLGLPTTKTRVLLVSTDMNEHELKIRWEAPFTPLFDILCLSGFDCTKPGFSQTEVYGIVQEHIERAGIGLVMIDALGGIHTGRSAKDDEVADMVIGRLNTWLPDTAILLLGHDRKTRWGPGGEPQPPDAEDFLGSQKWRANVTSQLHMWPVGDHVSKLQHDKSQVSVKWEDSIRVYIDLHGQAELYSEWRAKEVSDKYNKAVLELQLQALPTEERVQAVMKYYGVSRRTVYRWKTLAQAE